jgi:S1-C subfamily serine protease
MSAATLFTAIAETITTLTDRVSPSVVAIGKGGRGSGIVIDTNRVLTNAHHLKDNTTSVHFADGRTTQARVVGLDPTLDLAVLEVETGSAEAVTWAEAGPALGAIVFCASRAGGQFSLSHGFVSAADRTFHSPMRQPISGAFEHTAPLRQGSSGGPVLDQESRIIGLNVIRESDSFALAIPATAALRRRVSELSGVASPEV